jgi:hypothetical protein
LVSETGPDQMVSAWRALAASHAAVCSALERELGERHGLGVSDFEVLDRRGIYVTLTEAGRLRHAEAAPTHRDVITGVLAHMSAHG